jgi:antitoxin MazE
VVKIRKWGNSLALRIPGHLALAAQLREGSEVEIKLSKQRLVIVKKPSKTRRQYKLEELVSLITPANVHAETGWGAPTGREQW